MADPARLQGRVAIVTGAASPRGIGHAAAARMVAEGATVVLTDLHGPAVEAAAASIAAGGAASAMALDVTRAEQWDRVIDAVISRHGRLDILVNNAGRAIMAPLAAQPVEDFDALIAVNLRGTLLGCRAAAKVMRPGGGAAIVNVASVAGVVGVPGLAAYSATKGGIRMLTKSLALELAGDGIRVNAVFPGMVDTDFFHETALGDPGASDAIRARIPMGRLAQAAEIAGCIAFLASDDASYATGAEFVIDGGYSAQ